MKDKPKRSHHRKVVPLVKAVSKAVVEPLPEVLIVKMPPSPEPPAPQPPLPPVTLSRWARFHIWVGLLPSRVRHAVADAFAQSKDSQEYEPPRCIRCNEPNSAHDALDHRFQQ